MSQHTTFIRRLKKVSAHHLFFLVVLSLFVGGSVFSSQTFPSQMFMVFEDHKDAVVEYIIKTKNQPTNQEDAAYYTSRLGPSVLDGLRQTKMLQERQAQLFLDASRLQDKNPQLYYNLFLIYQEREKKETAASFLNKAQQIDPQLNP